MQQVFTRWVAVEGEIKDGDHFITEEGFVYTNDGISTLDRTHDKRAELYLCSTNLKVGDKVRFRLWYKGPERECEVEDYWEDSDQRTAVIKDGDYRVHTTPDSLCFKLLGIVSPDARNYINSGRRFSEDQWRYWEQVFKIEWPKDKPQKAGDHHLQIVVQFKGDCGHFH